MRRADRKRRARRVTRPGAGSSAAITMMRSDSTNFMMARLVARLQARMSRQAAGFGQPSLRGGGDDTAG
jgi:hypothetical protein